MFDISDPSAPTALWGLASNFREVNLTASLDLAHFDPVHVVISADFVKNTAFNREKVLRLIPGSPRDPGSIGYQTRLTVGMPQMQKAGDWQVFATYRYVQSDAVLDAFTDSDFHLGGTNTKGYIVGGSYGIAKNTWLTARYYSADQIDNFLPLGIDVLFLDFNARF